MLVDSQGMESILYNAAQLRIMKLVEGGAYII
jgi:hypothetical protein